LNKPRIAMAAVMFALSLSTAAWAEWMPWTVHDNLDPLTDDRNYFVTTVLLESPHAISPDALVMINCLPNLSPVAFGVGVGTSGDVVLAENTVISLRIGDDDMMRVPAMIMNRGFLTIALVNDQYGATERLAEGESLAWRISQTSKSFDGSPDSTELREFVASCKVWRAEEAPAD